MDVRTVMSEMGDAIMGTGSAQGENRGRQAAEQAIKSPLLENIAINGARGVLLNITGGSDLTLAEVYEAAEVVFKAADEREANIIFGTVVSERFDGSVQVTVLATGFDGGRPIESDRMIARERMPVRGATDDLDALVPAYIRQSDAELGGNT